MKGLFILLYLITMLSIQAFSQSESIPTELKKVFMNLPIDTTLDILRLAIYNQDSITENPVLWYYGGEFNHHNYFSPQAEVYTFNIYIEDTVLLIELDLNYPDSHNQFEIESQFTTLIETFEALSTSKVPFNVLEKGFIFAECFKFYKLDEKDHYLSICKSYDFIRIFYIRPQF